MPGCIPTCDACGKGTVREWFMVHDAVWAAAGLPNVRGVFRVGCFEAKLGRELEPDDFQDVPTNEPDLLVDTDRLLLKKGFVRRQTDDATGQILELPVVDLDTPLS